MINIRQNKEFELIILISYLNTTTKLNANVWKEKKRVRREKKEKIIAT